MGFVKSIGKGLLYVISFPIIIIGVALYCVVGLFIYLFQLGKLIFLFFTGRKLSNELEEDVKAQAIINKDKEETEDSQLSLYPSDSVLYEDNGYSSPVFKESEENKDE